jgi:hypothetical protein
MLTDSPRMTQANLIKVRVDARTKDQRSAQSLSAFLLTFTDGPETRPGSRTQYADLAGTRRGGTTLRGYVCAGRPGGGG